MARYVSSSVDNNWGFPQLAHFVGVAEAMDFELRHFLKREIRSI